jgi:hypothetical protein
MTQTLTLKADFQAGINWLSALADASNRFPEVRDALLGFLEAGEEFFTLQSDSRPALGADHLVVRLDPSDRLVGFVSALWARYPDACVLEHLLPPSNLKHDNTAGYR